MTDQQITALAREYGEEASKRLRNAFGDLSEWEYYNIRDEAKENAENVLRFLLSRYALVEKSKLSKEYKSAKHDSKMAHRERLYTMLAVASARKALLESLFPEIAKEVEG